MPGSEMRPEQINRRMIEYAPSADKKGAGVVDSEQEQKKRERLEYYRKRLFPDLEVVLTRIEKDDSEREQKRKSQGEAWTRLVNLGGVVRDELVLTSRTKKNDRLRRGIFDNQDTARSAISFLSRDELIVRRPDRVEQDIDFLAGIGVDSGLMRQVVTERAEKYRGGLAVPRAEAQTPEAPGINPFQHDLERRLVMAGDNPEERRIAIREWQKRNADHAEEIPPDVRTLAQEELRKAQDALQERTDERRRHVREMTIEGEEELAEMRQAMIEHVSFLYANADPENTFKSFLNEQANRRGGFGRHFAIEVEAELRKEYIARAELSIVQAFWDDIGTKVSPEYDAFQDMSVAKIDSCRRISRDTYKWLATQGKVDMLVAGELKKISLTDELDAALKIIHSCIYVGDPTDPENDKLNTWTTSGTDRIDKINELAAHYDLDKNSMLMAWQLATAECWVAGANFVFTSHPAYRLVDFDGHRYFCASKGMPIPGGARLWVDFRQSTSRGGAPGPDIFKVEGESFARVGYQSWPGGEQALLQGRYLSALNVDIVAGEADKTYIDAWLPQTSVMLDIVKAADVFNKIEAMGKAKASEFNIKLIGDIRSKLVSAYFRLEDRTLGGAERTARARLRAGSVVDEWAKSFLWIPSYANPANVFDDQLMPIRAHVELFRNMITTFDEDGQFQFVWRGGQWVFSPDESKKGWGLYVGYGRPLESEHGIMGSKVVAREFVEKYVIPFYDKVDDMLGDGREKPNVSKQKREEDNEAFTMAWDSDYWSHRGTIAGIRSPFKLGEKDRRWWLR